ncbi:MAG: TonB-dependent receptor [Pseudoxanthomonas sp.]
MTVSAAKGVKKATGALGTKTELELPFSTKTKSSLDIDRIQAASTGALFASDSSVARTGSDYNPYAMRGLTIRGLPVDLYNSLRIDGLPTGFLYGVNLPLEDMDQVQLLKGAAGFMYGFAAPGGIFNYTLKQPTLSPLLSFDVGYRSTNLYSQHLDVGGRMFGNENLGYRLNLSHESGTSYTGSQIERKAAALALEAQITPNLTWQANVLAQEGTIDHPQPIFYGGSYTQTKLPKAISGSSNWSADQDVNRTKFAYVTTGIDWAFTDNWHLLVDLSHARTRFRFSQEYIYLLDDSGYYRDSTSDLMNVAVSDYGQALLQGNFSTGPLRHNVVTGVSYQKSAYDVPLTNYSDYVPKAIAVHRTYGNIYSPTKISWDAMGDSLTTYRAETTVQKSAFLSDTVDFDDHWSLIAGWRFNDYTDDSASGSANAAAGIFNRYAKKATTPTYALMYKPAAGQTVYASYVESLEQGSLVGSSYANAGETLPPLLSKQYELGYKAERRRWNAAAAVFRVDRGASYANASNYYVQEGIVRYDGAEVSADASITPSLRLGGSVTWLDARYVKTSTTWLIGKPPTGVSKAVSTLNLQYQPSQVPGLSFYANARYVSEGVAATNTSLQIVVKAPAYTVFDIGGGYQLPWGQHQVTVRAGINNLFDKHYWQAGSGVLSIGAPRVYWVNLKYDW